jgi:hypothetical protein
LIDGNVFADDDEAKERIDRDENGVAHRRGGCMKRREQKRDGAEECDE